MRIVVAIVALTQLIALPTKSLHAADLQGELKGVLIWFYTLEVKGDKTSGNVLGFKQTAGVSLPHHKIHDIRPLSPQSSVIQDEDGNWFLDVSRERIVVTKIRPLFLGQVLSITKQGNVPKRLSARHNVPLNAIQYDKEMDQYLVDRKDLLISDLAITEVRERLMAANPRLLDYVVAVDRYVHDQLDYGNCERPNTAVDLLSFSKGRCGEYAKLKQSLLRSAGIPTRDVYATRTDSYGPGIEGGDDSHVWLHAYIPRAGWITVPSTRQLKPPFLAFQGGYHPEGYFVRALDLYKHEDEIQRKLYTYNALQRSGGIRGNGMLLRVPHREFNNIQTVVSKILDYDKVPDQSIFEEIARLPTQAQPLAYWFLVSAPEASIHEKAVAEFARSLKRRNDLKLESFLAVSPTLVSQRIKAVIGSDGR